MGRRWQMTPVLELEPLGMDSKLEKQRARARRVAEVAVPDSGLAQVPELGRRMVEVLLAQGQGQVRELELERVEVKRLARKGPTTR